MDKRPKHVNRQTNQTAALSLPWFSAAAEWGFWTCFRNTLCRAMALQQFKLLRESFRHPLEMFAALHARWVLWVVLHLTVPLPVPGFI